MKKYIVLIGFILFFQVQNLLAQNGVSHDIFDKLLKKNVSNDGWVNYRGFSQDKDQFNKYLEMLSSNPPQKNWTANQEVAYWINAYNAFTIKLILNHSDKKITSIKDIGDKIKIPFVNTPWDLKFIKIGQETYDLNNIEHGILRKKFKEPRIHVALVCAAKSCPPLLNAAYQPGQLSQQLDAQAVKFINDPTKNNVSENEMKISKIFDWYKMDFKNKGVFDFINKYATKKAKDKTKITYNNYDWSLNGVL
jgi:hypothetical protein